MLSRLRHARRLFRVGRVLLRYRLDALLEGDGLPRGLVVLRPLLPRARGAIAATAPAVRLRLALEALGPIFVKFGQILSTRRDLIPPEIADELARLRDQVAPFDGALAREQIEAGLGRPLEACFEHFSEVPLASASIAQVHAARLPGGREVVVKVLRPGIQARIDDDIALLRLLAGLVQRHHPRAHRIRPLAVVEEIESTLQAELDLQREGANASVLRRHWQGSPDLYIPEVFWSHSCESVLTCERVQGIAADDLAALDAAGIERKALAAKAVRVFYQQVFRDNFFHADAHPGNIWVDPDPARADDPRFIALDFGIVGQLSARDRYYLAENFMAIFRRDYRRIAELHLEAGWIPPSIRCEALEAAARAVCEPYFTRPLSQVSLGQVLLKLFRTAQRNQLTLQPQLILMQKTLLNVEGLARQLDPQLDMWAVARPVLEEIARQRLRPSRLVQELRQQVPALLLQLPEVSQRLQSWLRQQGEFRPGLFPLPPSFPSTPGLPQAEGCERSPGGRAQAVARIVHAVCAAALINAAALLYAFDHSGPRWLGLPLSAWGCAAAAALALFLARARRSDCDPG